MLNMAYYFRFLSRIPTVLFTFSSMYQRAESVIKLPWVKPVKVIATKICRIHLQSRYEDESL
jgi:hypothetical protein